MPDYPVPATYEEYFTAEEDFILDRALELIASGQYLQQDYFAEIDAAAESGRKPGIWWWVIGVVAVAVVFGISVVRKKRG